MAPARWVKTWVPQEVISPGGKCLLLKWVREDKLKALEEKSKEEVLKEETKLEPNTETLFLCSYEGCRKAFTDHHLWRKHAPIHGERQYVCHFDGCGKKFLDSSKLKRHFLIHTGERNFVCPHEGCHKAFSLDFNLRAHMKTHSLENYHVCPYPDCGKRYTQENKLNSHIKSHHQKNGGGIEIIKQTPLPKEKTRVATITPKPTPASKEPKTVSPNRPFACHYDGCNKAYIHQYKLNLHLRKEHPDHDSAQQQQQQQQIGANSVSSSSKKNKREMQQERLQEMRPQKIVRKEESLDVGDGVSTDFNAAGLGNQWGNQEEEDSEETEDDGDSDDDDDADDDNDDDDEETEDDD